MPVVSIGSLDLLTEQKAVLARKITALIAEQTRVPEDRVYVFFDGHEPSEIAAGGVLNSDLPTSVLRQFVTKYTAGLEEAPGVSVLTRVRARPGLRDEAEEAILSFALKTRDEPGCVGYDIYRSKMDLYRHAETSGYFVFQERWRDMEAINEHLRMPFFAEFMAKHDVLFDTPFEVTGRMGSSTGSWFPETPEQIKVVLHLKAQPENAGAIRDGVITMAEAMCARPGCLRYEPYQGLEGIFDTNVFMVDQVWDSMDSFTSAAQYLLANMPFFIEDLAEPRQPILFEMVTEPAKPRPVSVGKVTLRENAVLADEELQAGLRKLNPDFGELCIQASGVIWGKPLIDQRTKVLIAIAVDVVEQITGPAFANHVEMAMRQGITREELEELFLFMTVYAGFNKAGTFYRELNAVLGPTASES